MKIVVNIPVGPLDRMGYQYNYAIAIESAARFADHVYVMSSTRDDAVARAAVAPYANVSLISDANTWFELDAEGREYYRMARFEEALDYIEEVARAAGFDALLMIHINHYIPVAAHEALRRDCAAMLAAGDLFAWLYKRHLFADQLYHADQRRPYILNLTTDPLKLVAPDTLINQRTGERTPSESGDYSACDARAIVDFPLEQTVADLAESRRFLDHYYDVHPATPVFNPQNYFVRLMERYGERQATGEPVDDFGRQVMKNHRPDFISAIFLRQQARHNRQKRWRKTYAARLLRVSGRLLARILPAPATVAWKRHLWRLRWHTRSYPPAHRASLIAQLRTTWPRRTQQAGNRVHFLVNTLMKLCPSVVTNARVLCIGSRNSYEIDYFRSCGFTDVTGIDLFSEHPAIKVMDMHALTFTDDSFDIIYSAHSLEHAYDSAKVIAEIARVARPGALVIVETPVRFTPSAVEPIDFGSTDGLLSAFAACTASVLWTEEAEPHTITNPEDTALARIIIQMKA